jgi:protein phosphatase 1 regulatory subunit 37
MASPSSSCSPSSSAVTIPIPGKSILKRPPPTQTGIFSRIKGFLPTQSPTSASDDVKPLKCAHFILPKLVTVYPISSVNPPSTPGLKDEKRAIEEREAERRRRVVRGNSIGPNETEDWWNLDKVESFYRECCASREEEPDPAISAAFKVTKFTCGFREHIKLISDGCTQQRASGTNPRSVDLSGVQLTPTSAAILSDVFTIEWGLRKLTLRECDLDDYVTWFSPGCLHCSHHNPEIETYASRPAYSWHPCFPVRRVKPSPKSTRVQSAWLLCFKSELFLQITMQLLMYSIARQKVFNFSTSPKPI